MDLVEDTSFECSALPLVIGPAKSIYIHDLGGTMHALGLIPGCGVGEVARVVQAVEILTARFQSTSDGTVVSASSWFHRQQLTATAAKDYTRRASSGSTHHKLPGTLWLPESADPQIFCRPFRWRH